MNKAFANSFRGQFGGHGEGKPVDVPYAMLKGARHSGQLNLSNRQLDEVPLKVWRINVDVPEEAKNISLADNDERWWDQVDLRKLILASNQLKSIPGDIQHVCALTVLDAHDNQIESISEEIGILKELYKIHLSHNKIAKLPNSFFNLDQLKVLLLTSNEIQELPEEFGQLSNIEELQMSENKLITLPESFGNLKKLQKLNLSKNQLERFPECFSNLVSLIDLDVSSNKLTGLPNGFGQLTSLSILECRNNQIAIFNSFNEPTSIKQLFLGNNRITELDDDVFNKMPQLVSLDLRDNRISTLSEAICNLPTLERIDLTNNFLSTLPYVIGNMTLKSLSLDGNPLRGIRRDVVAKGTQHVLAYLKSRIPPPPVEKPAEEAELKRGKIMEEQAKNINNNEENAKSLNPEENTSSNDSVSTNQPIAREPSKEAIDSYLVATTKVLTHSANSPTIPGDVWLPGAKITKVDFSKNTLTEFPSKMFDYADTMAEFNLSRNKLPSIPPALGELKKLTFIDLSNNMLTSLPVEINQLLHLLQITLSYNRFTKIPPELFQCPKLQTLLLANNQVAEIDVPGLMTLKTLQCLDLANNSIARVPPELGRVEWLKNLLLEGNCFRNPRPQIMVNGTQFILAYLRDRIPT